MEEQKWYKKRVCGCTHEWQVSKFTINSIDPDTSEVCKECGYYPWVYSKPHYYKIYKNKGASDEVCSP